MTLLRLLIFCVFSIGFLYLPAVLGFAAVVAPEQSTGSILYGPDGKPIGSRLVAQKFTRDDYFHPRPSACDYDGQGAAGSNLSPTNPDLAARAAAIAASYGATPDHPIPADLVTASGSGLDPDISLAGARYQVARVARARGLEETQLKGLIHDISRPIAGLAGSPILVNVLELNLALDQLSAAR
ncbi:potassium-transporting ATPase subunit C [Haloferula sargassicola]|uniref:Potassium-transporting ATPase KdpC subunit n=1 Tax=Haloferula sargassicola TaxID=490096 RepID=A0ABP9UPJ7_9BACT